MQRSTIANMACAVLLTVAGLTQSSVLAQQAASTPQPPKPGQNKATTIFMMNDFMVGNAFSETLQKKIALEANDMPVLDAIKSVLDQIGVKYEVAEDVKSDVKVTMTLKNVPASNALAMLIHEGKLGWMYEKKEDQERVRIMKGVVRPSNRVTFSTPDLHLEVPDPEELRASIAIAQDASRAAMEDAASVIELSNRLKQNYVVGFAASASLPDTRVKLDVRDADIRETLKKILGDAKLDYVLEEDVPSDMKRSFTFENTPIGTALDVVCKSAEIGWRAELTRGKADGEKKEAQADPKPLVRIGKKYATGSWRVTPLSPGVSFPTVPSGTNVYAPAGEGFSSLYREKRSTFTCPHCKGKATIVGSKDKESKLWKHCPMCGKEIDRKSSIQEEIHSHDHDTLVFGEDIFFPLFGDMVNDNEFESLFPLVEGFAWDIAPLYEGLLR